MYDNLIRTLRLKSDDTIHLPKGFAQSLMKPLDMLRWVRTFIVILSYWQVRRAGQTCI